MSGRNESFGSPVCEKCGGTGKVKVYSEDSKSLCVVVLCPVCKGNKHE